MISIAPVSGVCVLVSPERRMTRRRPHGSGVVVGSVVAGVLTLLALDWLELALLCFIWAAGGVHHRAPLSQSMLLDKLTVMVLSAPRTAVLWAIALT